MRGRGPSLIPEDYVTQEVGTWLLWSLPLLVITERATAGLVSARKQPSEHRQRTSAPPPGTRHAGAAPQQVMPQSRGKDAPSSRSFITASAEPGALTSSAGSDGCAPESASQAWGLAVTGLVGMSLWLQGGEPFW